MYYVLFFGLIIVFFNVDIGVMRNNNIIVLKLFSFEIFFINYKEKKCGLVVLVILYFVVMYLKIILLVFWGELMNISFEYFLIFVFLYSKYVYNYMVEINFIEKVGLSFNERIL